jgi:hypothetical protein
MLLEKPLRVRMEDDSSDWITLDANRAFKLQRCSSAPCALASERPAARTASGSEKRFSHMLYAAAAAAVRMLLPPLPSSRRS